MVASTEKHLKLVVSAYTQGAETGLSNISGAFSRLRSDAPGTAKALRDASNALDVRPMRQVNQEVEALRGHYRTLRDSGVLSQKELAQAADHLKTKTAQLRGEYGLVGTAQKQQIATTANLTTHLKRLAGAYLGLRAWQGYSEFSQRMAEVHTMTDLTAEGIGRLGDQITDISLRLPQSASELAGAQYDILSAGVALTDSTAALELAGKAAVAGVTDTKTASQVGLGVINAYGLGIDELGEVYDVLFQTVKNGVTTFPELAQNLGGTLPTAKAAGVDYREVAAAVAEMTKAGIKTPEATTALRGAINALAAPTAEAKKQFAALGITWDGLLPTLDQIAKKNLSIDQMRLLIPDVQARTGVLALTQNMDALRGTLDGMEQAGGSMEQAYSIMKDTPANQIKLLQNALSALVRELMGVAAAGMPAIQFLTKFIGENKSLVVALIGAGGALYALNVTNKALLTIGTTLDLLRKKKMADMALNAAGGLTQMAGAAGAAALAFKGLVVYQAALAPGRVMELVQTIREWRVAAGEADAAHRRLMAGVAENLDKFAAYKDFRLPGVDGKSTEQLQAYRAELAKTHAYWTNMLIDLQARSQQTNWLGQLTEDAKAAAAQLPAVEARLQQVKNELSQVGGALRTAAETGTQSVMTLEQALEMVSQATARTAYNDQLLADALTRAADTAGTLRAKVEELAAAYIEADAAARLAVGTEEHAAALKAKLDAETAYAQAVQQLRSQQWSEAAQQYADEEKRLKQHLERQLLEFETKLQLEWITQADFNYRKAKAEQDLAQAQVALRQQAVDKSAELYGEDSREYRQAVSAKIDAELALQRAARATQQQWRVMVGLADSGQKAGKRLAATLEEVGEAGERGGARAAAGIRQVGRAADEATAKVGRLKNAMAQSGGQGGGQGGGETGPSMSEWFAGVWNALTNKIMGLNWDDLARYEQEQRKNIYHRTARGSWMTESFNKHAADMVRQRRDQLRIEQQVRVQSAVNAIREQEQQAVGPVAPSARGAAKTLTVEFRAPNGQAVRGQFEEGEAGRLLDVLRQAGAVTA